MLRLSILILLQLTYIRSTTKRYVTYYWQTTSFTDRVYDYWNHGQIFIPGLQHIYTSTTRHPDIFPPWLTRSTTRTTHYELKDKKTFKLTTQRPSTTHVTAEPATDIDKTTPQATPTDKHTAYEETKPTKKTTDATKRSKLPPFSFEEAPNDGFTDPFSAFLRKFLRTLSVKNYSELPPLFKPFVSYMKELITDGDLNGLGDKVISYAKQWIEKLEGLIKSPDKLLAQCHYAYNMLSNRNNALDEDANKLFNFLDDMYDESEEEVMQIVLLEAIKFPNTNTTAEEIAYSFVNNVFLMPITRINGTSRKDDLVRMFIAAVEKSHNSSRRYFGNTYRRKRSRNDLHNKMKLKNELVKLTESNYKAIRDNMDNINTLIGKLKLDSSSSDTSVYEYGLKEKYDEADIIEEFKVKPVQNTTKKAKNEVQILRTHSDNIDESFSENKEYNKPVDYEQKHKETKNIKSLFDNLEKLLSFSDKSSVTPKDSSIHFRWGDIHKYPNFEHSTVFVPSRFLVTKLINKGVPYDSVTKSLKRKRKSSRFAYFNAATSKPITQRSIDLPRKIIKGRLKKGKDTHYNEIPLIYHPKKYPVHHEPKTELENNSIARITSERRPADLDTSERLESALQYIKFKPLNNQITKYTPISGIISKIGKSFRNGKIKIPRVQKNHKHITQYDVKDQEYINIKEIITDESEDSNTYSENSSESLDKPSNYGKRKYERLKHKYNMLKRLSERILSQNIVNIEHTQSTLDTISSLSGKVEEKHATSKNASEEFYHRIYETTKHGPRKIKINNINLFLDDYDGKVEIESDIQETPQARSVDYKNIIRKSFPLNTTTDKSANVTATEYSDAEKELKQNVNDAIRHMDFVNHNASRRSDDLKPGVEPVSHETDLEAVLKTNIYKAVKKLLKT